MHLVGIARGAARAADTDAAVIAGGDDQEAEHRLIVGRPEIDLDAVGVDVVGLVVEQQRRRVGPADDELRLANVHRHVDDPVIPPHGRGCGELFRPGIRLLAAPVLVFVVQLERRREVERVETAVERRRLVKAQSQAAHRCRPVPVDQRRLTASAAARRIPRSDTLAPSTVTSHPSLVFT